MEFKIQQDVFNKALKEVFKAVSKKDMLAIARGILATIEDNQLTLLGTDLTIAIKKTVECESVENGQVVIPAELFVRYVKELPNEEIKITVNENYKIKVTTGRGKVNFDGMNPKEFPSITKFTSEPITINQGDLKYLFEKVKDFKFKGDNQPTLSSVMLSKKDNQLVAVATDTARLSIASIDFNGIISDSETIIPARTVDTLTSMLGNQEANIYYKEGWLKFDLGDSILFSRLTSGMYPNYKSVMPDDNNVTIRVDKLQLESTVKRCIILSDDGVVNLTVNDDEMFVSSINSLSDEVDSIEKIECEKTGDDLSVNINGNYILDSLKASYSDVVICEGSGKKSPLIIKDENDENWLSLLMPIRV